MRIETHNRVHDAMASTFSLRAIEEEQTARRLERLVFVESAFRPRPDTSVRVKAIVKDADGKVLLLKDKSTGFYDLPGGHIKDGETPMQALVREVKEETGLAVADAKQKRADILNVGGQRAVVMFYQVDLLEQPEVEVTVSEEHTGFEWVEPNEALSLDTGAYSPHLKQSLSHKNAVLAKHDKRKARVQKVYDAALHKVLDKAKRETLVNLRRGTIEASAPKGHPFYGNQWTDIEVGKEQFAGETDKVPYRVLRIRNKAGDEIGHLEVAKFGGVWIPAHVEVKSEYRRKGIATALYDKAEQIVGPLTPAPHQTDDAKAFWKNRLGRIKAEDTGEATSKAEKLALQSPANEGGVLKAGGPGSGSWEGPGQPRFEWTKGHDEIVSRLKTGDTKGMTAKVLFRSVSDTRGIVEINGYKFAIDETGRLNRAGIPVDYSKRKSLTNRSLAEENAYFNRFPQLRSEHFKAAYKPNISARSFINASNPVAADIMFDVDSFSEEFKMAMRTAGKAAFKISARGLVGDLTKTGQRITDSGLVNQFLNQRENKLKEVPQGIYDDIKGRLEDAALEGLSESGMADAIRDAFDQTYEGRAETVARTETASVYETANAAAIESAGYTHKRWLSAEDDAVRPSHADVDGEIVPNDEPFSNGLMFPHDPNGPPEETINCRCTLVAADASEVEE